MKILNTIKKTVHRLTPRMIISVYHFLLVLSGAIFYRFPSSRLKVIGVTGTSGKSTVVELTAHILRTAGYKTASSSSIQFSLDDQSVRNELKMTMPGRWAMQRFLAQALEKGCQYVVLEITSEGISQHRHRFIDFDALVFTNISPEHIERHGSFEKYLQAKSLLFKGLKKSTKQNKATIINVDDKYTDHFLNFQADRKIGFGQKNNKKLSSGVYLESMELSPSGAQFSFDGNSVSWPLLGEFNVMNGLAAIAVACSQGIPCAKSAQALGQIKSIPGRMEVVVDNPFSVIVDYAHTPKALKSVYETARLGLKGKMILVLGGCGGGRDRWKRPVFGKIAEEFGDIIILTNEDPYEENPMTIIEQIRAGISSSFSGKCSIVLDRERAIKKAINLAQPQDVVIITGKGSESVICEANGRKTPWDDREVVRRLWGEIKGS
jgi:UDP-N-acetylmuramoyl-L-alanyl-D-glutamate--2,6-diaminopimelate ligase